MTFNHNALIRSTDVLSYLTLQALIWASSTPTADLLHTVVLRLPIKPQFNSLSSSIPTLTLQTKLNPNQPNSTQPNPNRLNPTNFNPNKPNSTQPNLTKPNQAISTQTNPTQPNPTQPNQTQSRQTQPNHYWPCKWPDCFYS